ncbi:MAG: LysR family transcriptional regulator [Burkholderiales bacterium]|nr:LysR family transcriptional regulator [Burkholderiales bacterium]
MQPELTAPHRIAPLRFRIQVKHDVAIGPGKADILSLIAETGSMAETGRRMGMSYQRIWTLVNAMNEHFNEPLVTKQRGGGSSGGAALTPAGLEVLRLYRLVEAEAEQAIAPHLKQLHSLMKAEVKDTAT